uniref:Uncharacterized protein n=1 Tax=Caenorhabditis japonica TaxID=281687 RepID=A0A8R1ITG0_CAEJA
MSIPYKSITCSINHTSRFEQRNSILLKPLKRPRDVESGRIVKTTYGENVNEHIAEHSIEPNLFFCQMQCCLFVWNDLRVLNQPDVVVVHLTD